MSEVLYQVRVRSVKEGSTWGIWVPCTKESYLDFLAHPEKHAIKDLVVEVRTLTVNAVSPMQYASTVASHVAEAERLKHELYLLKSAAFEVLTARDPDDEQFGYPGHCHRVRGKWDRDGSTCEQCAAFDRLSKLLGELK